MHHFFTPHRPVPTVHTTPRAKVKPGQVQALKADYHNASGQVIGQEQFADGARQFQDMLGGVETAAREEECHRHRDAAAIAFH
jgi:hypothetical protein